MKKIQKCVFSIPVILTLLSYGIAQATADSQFSCLLGQEFEAKIQGLTGSISQKFFMLRGCNQQLHIFTKTKASTQDSTIEFQSSINKKLCDEADGSFLADRIEASTKFKVIEGEQQRVHLLDQNDQLMVVLVHKPKLRTPHIDTATLNGDYNLFFPSINLYFPGPGRVVIEACNMVSGIYRLSDNGTLAFEGVRKFGSCESKYHNYVVDAISNSTFLNPTDESECEFAFVRSQNQLDIVIAPVSPAQAPTISGNYYLYLTGSALRPIIVIVTNDKFSFRGCSQITFTYATADFNSIQFDNFQVTPGFCTVNNDQKYIDNFKQVDRLEFDKDTGKLRLFGGRSQVPIYSPQREYSSPIPFLTGNYSFTIPGLGYEPMKVTFTEDSTEILRLVLHGCNRIQISWVKQQSQLSSFGSLAQSDRYCDPDRDEDFSDRLRQTVRLDYDQNTKQLKLMDSLNSVVLVGTGYEEPIETPSESSLRGQRTFSFPRSNLKPIQIQILNDNNQFLMFSFMGCNRWNVTLTKGNSDLVSFSRVLRSTAVNACSQDRDNEYIALLKQITKRAFYPNTLDLALQNQRGEVVVTTNQEIQSQLFGQFNLYLIDSNLNPITVTVTTHNEFSFKGCKTHLWKNTETLSETINFTNFTSTSAFCSDDSDNEYIQKFKEVRKFKFNPTTNLLRLYGEDSELIYSTEANDFQLGRPRPLYRGNFILAFPGQDNMDPIKVQIFQSDVEVLFTVNGCNTLNFTYTKINKYTLRGLQINQTRVRLCVPQFDGHYMRIFTQILKFTYNQESGLTSFINGHQKVIAIIKQSRETDSQERISLGDFSLIIPGKDSVQVTVAEQGQHLKFMLKGCNFYNFTYTKGNQDRVSYSGYMWFIKREVCKTNNDDEYVNLMKQVTKIAIDPNYEGIVLQREKGEVVLTMEKEVNSSLVGKYNLYFVGSNFYPITVTVTEDGFSFTGCKSHLWRYTVTLSKTINFHNFTSTSKFCLNDYDNEYINKFKEVRKFQFNPATKLLRLYGSDSKLFYSTVYKDYIEMRPQLQTTSNYTFNFIDSDFPFVKAKISESLQYITFMFTGCNTYNLMFYKSRSNGLTFIIQNSFTKQTCIPDHDADYVAKFHQLLNSSFNRELMKLNLQNTPQIIVMEQQNNEQADFSQFRVVGEYKLYRPNIYFDSITIEISEDRLFFYFILKGCNQYNISLLKLDQDRVSYSRLAFSAAVARCVINRDQYYLNSLTQTAKIQYMGNFQNVSLEDKNGNILFTNNPQARPPLSGRFNLNQPDSVFGSIQVVISENANYIQLIYRGCYEDTFYFAKKDMNRVYLSHIVRSEASQECDANRNRNYDRLLRSIQAMIYDKQTQDISLRNKKGVVVLTAKQFKT